MFTNRNSQSEAIGLTSRDNFPESYAFLLLSSLSFQLFRSFPAFDPPLDSAFSPESHLREGTPFTRVASRFTALSATDSFAYQASFSPEPVPILRPDRPALLVSSTSWTADEDFEILLEALRIYEKRAKVMNVIDDNGRNVENVVEEDEKDVEGDRKAPRAKKRLPKVIMIVTGKGDLREKIMSEVIDLEHREKWEWVRCRDVWLSADDYPLLLGGLTLLEVVHL